MTTPSAPLLAGAAEAVELAQRLVDEACGAVRAHGGIDANQVVAYDVAHAAAAVATARAALEYGGHGETEARIAAAFVADVIAELAGKVAGREPLWGVDSGWAAPAAGFLAAQRDPAVLAGLAATEGPRHLGEDFELVRETFHRFAEDKVRPHAEHVHRENADIPEEVIQGLAELGGFGLSVPEEYGGFASGGESDYMGMVVATEELSWGSLGVGGSLITRPEILTRALVYGGTEEQKKHWLPKLASAEILAAVAVTEPDFGSDVAGIVTAAAPVEGGWVVNGVKTWCTFAARADVLMLLARTDPDRSLAHRGHLHVRRREAARRRPRLRLHPGGRNGPAARPGAGAPGGPSHRHARLPRHALLRAGLRELVRARGEPRRRPGGAGQGLLPPDAGLRERAAPDGGARRSASCRPPTRRRRRTPPSARCSDRPSATTS